MRLVDTSVIVDHLRGYSPASELLDELLAEDVRLMTSELVRFELLAGVRSKDEEALETFLEVVDIVPVVEPIARQGAALARAHRGSHSGIDSVDYLIAATSMVLDAPLLTRNVRHFPMLENLTSPY